ITGDQGQVGIYSANYRIAVMMTLFIQMFRYAFEPFLFAVSGDRKAPETYARVMKYFVITGLLVFLLTKLYIDFFKVILLRKTEFWEGLNVVPIVLMANLFLGIYYNLSVWYKVRDLTRYAAIMATIGALVTIVLNWTLVPRIGYMGSAWATLACYSVMMLISWLWGRKVYPIPYETKRIGLWMVFAVILYLISFFFRMDNLWVRLIMNTGLLLVFILLVGYSERAMLTPLLKECENGSGGNYIIEKPFYNVLYSSLFFFTLLYRLTGIALQHESKHCQPLQTRVTLLQHRIIGRNGSTGQFG
ncbi:MAG: polysaccharide biosynthesis protein, partial [Bacteroidales bacterium]|nr:polysaccharide biosynthesis protein [Bacteroidales bacterium]